MQRPLTHSRENNPPVSQAEWSDVVTVDVLSSPVFGIRVSFLCLLVHLA